MVARCRQSCWTARISLCEGTRRSSIPTVLYLVMRGVCSSPTPLGRPGAYWYCCAAGKLCLSTTMGPFFDVFRRMGLWFLSGQGCAGLCGPRYRWEEEEFEKKRYSYLYGDAGSEDLGSTLAWSWRQCTRTRILDAYEFCLTIDRPVTWVEKKAGNMEDDGVAQVMAAIGFPSAPQPARRSVLSGDLFDGPQPKDGIDLDSGLPKVVKRSSKERQQLAEPYPFTMSGAQISSADRMVPFPDSASGGGVQSPSSAATSGSTDEIDATENPTTSSGKPRESGSLSSFGQPVSSRYPFQFRQPPGGNARAPQRGRTDSSPGTAGTSSSSDDAAGEVSDSGLSGAAHSGDSHERDQPTSSSDESGTSSIPMPPRHPQQAEGRRARRRAGTAPITPATSSTIVHPVLFPRASIPIIIPGYEEQGHHTMDDNHSIASSHSEDDSTGLLSPASAHSARSPRPSFIANMMGGVRASAPGSRTQSQSSAVSSGTSSHPSSSSRSFHSSLGSVNVSVVGNRSRSPSRPRASLPRTRTTSASAYVRSRAQSLMQGIGAASHSSLELVQNVIHRSRTNSMMARLDEGEHEGSIVGDSMRLAQSPLRQLTSNTNDNEDNEVDEGVEYDARISGLYDAQQQHADISYYSDGRTHSRSGSGSTSAMSSSNENYTFGQPFPHRTRLPQVGEGQTVEEEGEQEEEQVPMAGRAASDNSSSSSRSRSSRRPTPPTVPVPAALSPMRPRTYHTAATAGGEVSLSSTPPDMISTAAASFVTGSATVTPTVESSVLSSAGAHNDKVERPDA